MNKIIHYLVDHRTQLFASSIYTMETPDKKKSVGPYLYYGDTKIDLRIVIAVLVVIIVVLIAALVSTLDQSDAGLYGMFQIDDAFKEKACLDAMFMYIGPPKGDANNTIGIVGSRVPVVMIIKADGGVVANESVKAFVRRVNSSSSTPKYAIDFGKPIGIIPRRVRLTYDLPSGLLLMRSGKKIFARMFKQNEASFYCQMQPSLKGEGDVDGDSSDSDTDDAGSASDSD